MTKQNRRETLLQSVIKASRLRPTHIVRAAQRLSREMGLPSISRYHLTRLARGDSEPRRDRMRVVAAAIRDLTGIPFRLGDLFEVDEPALAAAGRAGGLADGSNPSVPVSSSFDRLAHAWRVFVPDQTGGSPGETFETLFLEYGALLRGVAMRRYGIPPDDAEEMVQECFIAYLQRHTYIRDTRGWLYGTLRYRCFDWLRTRGREIPLEPEHEERPDERQDAARDKLVRQLTFSAVLAQLGQKCRETLHGVYQGENQRDLAQRLSTTPGYVDQLISTCRRRAAEVFRAMGLRRK